MSKELEQPNIVVVGDVCIDTNHTEHGEIYTGWGGPGPYGARAARQRIQTCHHAETAVPPRLTRPMLDLIRAADILVVAPLTPNYPLASVQSILNQKQEDALTVLCPQGFFRDIQPDGTIKPRQFTEFADFVPLVDLVILSEEDTHDARNQASRWTGSTRDTHAIITQGALGATIVDKRGNARRVPTESVPPEAILDSVGCGDFFAMGTAIAYWRNGNGIEAAVAEGNRIAGQKLLGSFALAK